MRPTLWELDSQTEKGGEFIHISVVFVAKHCHIIHTKQSQGFFKEKKSQFFSLPFALVILLELYYFG